MSRLSQQAWALYTAHRNFALYVVIGGAATVVDMAVLLGFTELAGLHYLGSAALAYLAGMVTNYSLNRRLNFKSTTTRIGRQFLVFALVAGVGLGLTQGILWALVELAGAWYMAAKVVAVGMVLAWSYLAHKHITFGWAG